MKPTLFIIIFILLIGSDVFSQDVDMDMDYENSDFYGNVYTDINEIEADENNEGINKPLLLFLGVTAVEFWEGIMNSQIMLSFKLRAFPGLGEVSTIRQFFLEDQIILQNEGIEAYRTNIFQKYYMKGFVETGSHLNICTLTESELKALSTVQRQYISIIHKFVVRLEKSFSLPPDGMMPDAEKMLQTILKENSSIFSKMAAGIGRKFLSVVSKVKSIGKGLSVLIILPLDIAIHNAKDAVEENIRNSNQYDKNINPGGII